MWFRNRRGCVNQTFTLKLIIEMSLNHQTPLVFNLIDYEHSLDTNTVMKIRFIFGTQCAVAMLAAGARKLAAQLGYPYWYLSCVCNKTKLRSRLWCCSTIYAMERGLGGGAKFRVLYQKLLMGNIGVFITVYWYLRCDYEQVFDSADRRNLTKIISFFHLKRLNHKNDKAMYENHVALVEVGREVSVGLYLNRS